ncbi:MAG: hypothetical protein KGZ53_01170 [Peptococcaceae bacterium]|nr:hypothetical protein [Peptococcaceae bacterium]
MHKSRATVIVLLTVTTSGLRRWLDSNGILDDGWIKEKDILRMAEAGWG